MRSTASRDCEGFTSASSGVAPEVISRERLCWLERGVSEDQLVVMYAKLFGNLLCSVQNYTAHTHVAQHAYAEAKNEAKNSTKHMEVKRGSGLDCKERTHLHSYSSCLTIAGLQPCFLFLFLTNCCQNPQGKARSFTTVRKVHSLPAGWPRVHWYINHDFSSNLKYLWLLILLYFQIRLNKSARVDARWRKLSDIKRFCASSTVLAACFLPSLQKWDRNWIWIRLLTQTSCSEFKVFISCAKLLQHWLRREAQICSIKSCFLLQSLPIMHSISPPVWLGPCEEIIICWIFKTPELFLSCHVGVLLVPIYMLLISIFSFTFILQICTFIFEVR